MGEMNFTSNWISLTYVSTEVYKCNDWQESARKKQRRNSIGHLKTPETRLMIVDEITKYSPEVLEYVRILLPQLSKNAAIPSERLARRIVESDATRLLVAREGNDILGMLTIVIIPLPSGVRAWIEDVVVDEFGRGKGVGEALSQHALIFAKAEGANTVGLTSRPSRDAANRLYQRIGFVPRDTNVYRFEFEP